MDPHPKKRNGVFISYSHQDQEWLRRLQVHLKPLERDHAIDIWDDTKIQPGIRWQTEIRNALAAAKVAVLLISADFLASDFITTDELPTLLEASEKEGVVILPIILSASRFSKTRGLAHFQSVNPPSRPLIDLPRGEQEAVLVATSEHIEAALRHEPAASTSVEKSSAPAPDTGRHRRPVPAGSFPFAPKHRIGLFGLIGAGALLITIAVIQTASEGGPGYFFDDFTGRQLGSDWDVIDPDDTHLTLQPDAGSLLIVTQAGSIWEDGRNLKNQLVLRKDLPDGDYEVIVKASLQILNQHNSLSVALYQGPDEFLEIGYWGQEWGYNVRRTMHFTKESGGERNSLLAEGAFGASEASEPFYLKIVRQGNRYSGFYAFVDARTPDDIEGISWASIGTQNWIDFEGNLALWADNSNREVYGGPPSPPEVPAEFDSVLVRELAIAEP